MKAKHSGNVLEILKKVLLIVICFNMSLERCNSSRILVVPMAHSSHVNFLSVVGEALNSNGHDVYVLTVTNFSKIVRKYHLNEIIINIEMKSDLIQDIVIGENNNNILNLLSMFIKEVEHLLRGLFADETTMNKIAELNFDLMIIDGFDIFRYFYLLPYKLNVPFVTINARPDPWTARVPALPSIEGMMPLVILDENSNIFHRVFNIFAYTVVRLLLPSSPFSPFKDNLFNELLPEKENIGFSQLYLKSEMILVNMDIVCLDFPRVSSPYYQYIGGLGVQPAKTLPEDLNKIVSSASGVIVLTFGSGIKSLPLNLLKKFLIVFDQRSETVLMRHVHDGTELKENGITIPSNVYLMSWLPQNDLLAHNKTRLFISHGGNNGQLEAVYHGVPVLTMPMFGDQFYNARRMEAHDFGRQLDPKELTTEQLRATLNELLGNPVYDTNIKKCSNILKKMPTPQKVAIFWIEHILEFGGSHLRPYYVDMPLWKVFMLDVLVFVTIALIVLYYVVKKTYRFCFGKRKVKPSNKKGKKKD